MFGKVQERPDDLKMERMRAPIGDKPRNRMLSAESIISFKSHFIAPNDTCTSG